MPTQSASCNPARTITRGQYKSDCPEWSCKAWSQSGTSRLSDGQHAWAHRDTSVTIVSSAGFDAFQPAARWHGGSSQASLYRGKFGQGMERRGLTPVIANAGAANCRCASFKHRPCGGDPSFESFG